MVEVGSEGRDARVILRWAHTRDRTFDATIASSCSYARSRAMLCMYPGNENQKYGRSWHRHAKANLLLSKCYSFRDKCSCIGSGREGQRVRSLNMGVYTSKPTIRV
jgi:hypothetical protein